MCRGPEPRSRTAIPDGRGSGPGPGSHTCPLGHFSEGGEDVRGLVELLGAVAAQPAFGRHPELGQVPACQLDPRLRPGQPVGGGVHDAQVELRIRLQSEIGQRLPVRRAVPAPRKLTIARSITSARLLVKFSYWNYRN